MKNQYPFYTLCLALTMLTACSGEKKESASEKGVETVLPDTKNEVSVMTLKKQIFNHELVSNGKISARGMADLRFESGEVIAHIWVKNGDRVRKGQKLAELDKFKLDNQLSQSEDALKKSELELRDVLISQGYPADDISQVPEETMKLAKVKSGYDQSKSQYEMSKYNAEHATLTAPFDGVVANLFSKPYNLASTSDVFCTVIDMQGMEVDFTVLESELPLIKNGDKVVIKPYSDAATVHEGSISEINPLVDDKGMVKVRVSVHRSLGEQLVIPKSAVVLRSGKQAVFTLKDGKMAQWNYIHTALENADSYSVADGLTEGDTVIVSGNINLAHEAPVTIIE